MCLAGGRERLAEERRARAQRLLEKLGHKQVADDAEDAVYDQAYLQDCE